MGFSVQHMRQSIKNGSYCCQFPNEHCSAYNAPSSLSSCPHGQHGSRKGPKVAIALWCPIKYKPGGRIAAMLKGTTEGLGAMSEANAKV